jgi:hypothetical protein
MIRKFAWVLGFRVVPALIFFATILTGATTVSAQQAPPEPKPAEAAAAQQPADTQQSSSQEASPEESGPRRKSRPHDYKNWSFNIGGGGSLTNGNTRNFVRGGGGIGAVGVAHNYNKYFGLRADFQWDNLPLRTSALQLAQAPSATNYAYSVMADPVINIPVTKVWGGYFVGGFSYLHRSGKLDSSTAVPGSSCNAFWNWWGPCVNANLPLSKSFLSSSQDQFGENFGGGVTRRISTNVEIYGEFRYVHGKRNGITTDFRPITIGIRW